MGRIGHGVAPWEREQRVTDALEAVALLVRAVAAQAGVSLADLECRTAPASSGVRHAGPDQRWRGVAWGSVPLRA